MPTRLLFQVARRYASRLSRKIVACAPRQLFAVEFKTAISSMEEFALWRVQMRNAVDHFRRQNIWARDLGVWVWLSQDGQARGILSLGSTTQTEFSSAFARRWPTTLRPIASSDMKDELGAAIRPSMIAGPAAGGYQGLRLFVCPRKQMR